MGKPTRKAVAATRRTPTRPKSSKRTPVKKSTREKGREAPPAARRFQVEALDPAAKCGAGTSVEQLYRVTEAREGQSSSTHLVFFDRHGWYCLHGRTCPAVQHARAFGERARPARQPARGSTSHGPTHNGRMRA